ncbi:helix-turn-helix domain-containing protein [Saccharolobus caldissimus]|uniref:HTH bat-type domain-containing protein n=1 Tax=Saccharolobus caldissimus TaxID=1702097 RepID=A0AAQ4CVB1_9CREN|nr:helix-turn-helix domain-containing protein [Saccharolobus caldissimus]BDB99742.1 hypothetical protein SACC_27590 [Saccharolobus caldissimus]
MHVYKMRLKLKHDSCWTYKTTDFKVGGEVKYLFPLITKNSIFEIAEIYADDKNELVDFISTISRRYNNNIKVVKVDKPKSSKTALVYYFKTFNNSITRIMIENDAVITNLHMYNGIEEWVAYFFGEEEKILDNFMRDLKSTDAKVEDINFTKTKIDGMKNELVILNSLTPIERQILYTATKLGFFEYPKRVKLDELAKMFGVTKVTLDRHIRNGLRKILSQLFVNSYQ